MKSMRDIERTRRQYHEDSQSNTVHRTSLLAPHIPAMDVDISFVNHFLLKRGYENVACRLTAVGPDGQRVASRTYPIREPIVYAFELSELTSDDVANYIIEFFSPTNLFIPFPAVVVNHRNDHCLNSVHSYSRVLNDVFEDDAINSKSVCEASIDVRVDDTTDTFGIFTAGPTPCQGTVDVHVRSAQGALDAHVPVVTPRLTNRTISLRSLFGDALPEERAILTVQQPPQFMFYGRMLAGQRCTTDGAISANHSFYDSSAVEEYWPDARPSSRVYPIMDDLKTTIRLYPIFSPCRLLSAVDFFDAEAQLIKSVNCDPLPSPGEEVLDFCVSDFLHREGIEDARSFQFRVWPAEGNTPTRVNHQIVFAGPGNGPALAASTAISLKNPNAFQSAKKTGISWGQCAASAEFDSYLGIVFDHADGATGRVSLSLFGEAGQAYECEFEMAAGAAYVLQPADVVPDLVAPAGSRPHYLWYWATSERPDLSAYTVVRHKRSGHCSGDHSF